MPSAWGPRRALSLAIVAAAVGSASSAAAFTLRQTPAGTPLHWTEPQVAYVIDPSVGAIAGGQGAATNAVAAWSGAGGAPALAASVGRGGATPGLDGQNTVLFAPGGFAPAGGALAITITSYDESTGRIVDTDIVVNGAYHFSVLDPNAQPASGAASFTTDGSSRESDEPSWTAPFDLFHVLSHEVGH